MTKKILIAQKDLNAIRSGVPRLILSEISYFKDKGFVPYIVAERIDEKPFLMAGAVSHKTFRWPISGLFRRKFYMGRVDHAISKIKPDFIIGHGDIVNQDICFIHNCVHLAYELIHGKSIPKEHEMAQIHAEILTKKQFKVLVCNSKMMKEDLTKRFDLSDREVIIHYPELDSTIFGKGTNNIRGELGIDDDTIVIGLITSGGFKKRNVKLLLEVASQLDTQKKIHIIIAGKDKKDPFLKIISKSKFPITFLPPTNKVEEYYNSCDIFALPAHIEEFGMSVLEAMASRKPVVINNKVGASELIQGRSLDFILPSLDPNELEQRLLKLIENDELRLELGELNYEIAMKNSSFNQKQKFEDLLKLAGFY